jgi:hypothetical protein
MGLVVTIATGDSRPNAVVQNVYENRADSSRLLQGLRKSEGSGLETLQYRFPAGHQCADS